MDERVTRVEIQWEVGTIEAMCVRQSRLDCECSNPHAPSWIHGNTMCRDFNIHRWPVMEVSRARPSELRTEGSIGIDEKV